MIKKELVERIRNEKYESDLEDYLTELVYTKYSPFRYIQYLDKLSLTPLEREIIKFNLTNLAVRVIHENKPDKADLQSYGGDRTSIYVRYEHDWEILNMIFSKKIKVTYYDRSNLLKDKFDLGNKLDELEEEYEHNYRVYYGHIDESNEKIELESLMSDIKNKISDIDIMLDDREIFTLDQIVREELFLPNEEIKLLNSSELYDTYDVTNNKNIKIHKKRIGK